MKRKILALLLAAVMVLTLVGCGSSEKDQIVGSWICEKDMTNVFNQALAQDELSAKYLQVSSFTVMLYADFYEDDTYRFYADENHLNAQMQTVKDDLADGMGQYMVDLFEEQTGMVMSIDEILELAGFTMDDLMAELDIDAIAAEMVEGFRMEGKFKVEEGKLYTSADLQYNVDSSSYETCEFGDGQFTLTGYSGSQPPEFEIYPIVFRKK